MRNRITQKFNEEEIQQLVLYRDDHLLVVNKPSGLPVHNAGGSKHNLEQYFLWLMFEQTNKPHLVHRLDLGTSGCLAIARTSESARRMQELFTNQAIKKAYLADVRGTVVDECGKITVPLSKLSPEKKHWWMKADPQGMPAHTEFRVVSRNAHSTRLLLTPHTGRTHQLRVHCASIGHSIIGDYIYGEQREYESEYFLHLHAHYLEIPFINQQKPIVVTAPLPDHMNEISRQDQLFLPADLAKS